MVQLPGPLSRILDNFSRIPYENLSKAVKYNAMGVAENARRLPHEVLAGYKAKGTGGTCFSLTWLLHNTLEASGYSSYIVLCDRAYGVNTHCAAVLQLEEKKYLLDPGYLSFTPIELSGEKPTVVETPFNSISVHQDDTARYALFTEHCGQKKRRFTIKDEPIAERDFIAYWDASFALETLSYPVVTMLKGAKHLYLQKKNLYIRDRGGSETIALSEKNFPETVNAYFGIDTQIAAQARDLFF
ncbi:MAG: hypothetical protein A2268_02200 [Candidatus Raymondbacteria bacterium RifOxyA12_full_50_37]|uniref:Arylamine N-acetyltransferase n=1 Tax=Candidatus Raymondbacteria bacterium RIFOXYD12_FULL_49_13 TaxID=1817890 RepID=A0A1F7F5B9_UNCRA|nr:MAG: hypothetical protein A2268_02200 [Candidatus Raymondbacteria bacterium RifOxyA12_full_50_37]OGJ92238.1 MAG: hypothetical protein A2248_11030 [Candidatus Raymondbacteria bacterium RIFOXYA2_FULL_49_16]OGJ97854.1 MAG: hypothetical protein A2487_21535 [Candidatus Raymondbacteria bacterium RifOxyC12_full_50_8]OGJ98564.1 MAG: hypothetical protein A2453_06830 [Candidatus Raymondbacteria bacterium RIFOXYC2_FULL_50_21]OGK01865.1 MAG: hypothetical protein A2519_04725 [Candidatus Raymondbacteria b